MTSDPYRALIETFVQALQHAAFMSQSLTAAWVPAPTDAHWFCESPCYRFDDAEMRQRVLCTVFFANLPLRFILFGALKHTRDGYSMYNAMLAAIAAFNQYQDPAIWIQRCTNTDHYRFEQLEEKQKEIIRLRIWQLIRRYYFASCAEDYWVARLQCENIAVELEDLGIEAESEQFNRLYELAATSVGTPHSDELREVIDTRTLQPGYRNEDEDDFEN